MGQARALCPCYLQIPHSRGLLAGGALVSETVGEEEEDTVTVEGVVVTEVVVAFRPVKALVRAGEAVVAEDEGSGSAGLGQVIPLHSSGQNSRILM